MARNELAYTINGRFNDGGQLVPHIVVRCSNCTNELVFPKRYLEPPQHIAKRIRDKQWEFDLYNRKLSMCPECIQIRDNSRHGESGKKSIPLMGTRVLIPAQLLPSRAKPQEPLRHYAVVVETRRTWEQLRQFLEKGLTVVKIEQIDAEKARESARPEVPETILAPVEIPHADQRKAGARARVDAHRTRVHEAISEALHKAPNAGPKALAGYLNRIHVPTYGRAKSWTESNIGPHLEIFRRGIVTIPSGK